MRVVFDTNVFVSALLKEQFVPALAVRLVEKHHVLLKSSATESELLEVLARPSLAAFIAPTALDWVKKTLAAAEPVTTLRSFAGACRDPTDDKFLDLAVDGHADVIVSGDLDLQTLNRFAGVPIIAPAAFVLDPKAGAGRLLSTTHGGIGLGPSVSTTRIASARPGNRRSSASSTVLSIADASMRPSMTMPSDAWCAPDWATRPKYPEAWPSVARW